MLKKTMIVATSLVLAFGIACTKSNNDTVSRTDAVKAALTQAELTDVTVNEDRDKNTITLGGKVHSEAAKAQAATVAEAPASGRTVVNEISVQPVGLESEAKSANSKLDDAIEKNYDAALIHHGLDKQHIRYDAKNGVLTLKGSVKTPRARIEAAKLAESIPNVQQVVNQIDENRVDAGARTLLRACALLIPSHLLPDWAEVRLLSQCFRRAVSARLEWLQ